MDTEDLLRHRMLKFRSIGGFQEGIPVDPERKRNMKPSEVNMLKAADLESELENLKGKILDAKVPYDPITTQAIEKLKEDVDKEITKAFISMGLQEELKSLKLELSRLPDQPLNPNLQAKVEKIMQKFKQNLLRPGAYLGLKQKLEKLNTVSRVIEAKERSEKLKAEINKQVPAEVKTKLEHLRAAQEKVSEGDSLDKDLLEEVVNTKKELMEVLKSANLEIVGLTNRKMSTLPSELHEKIANVNKEISHEIERAINVSGLRGRIEELKAEIARGSSSEKVEKMEAEIRKDILSALDITGLKEKLENIRMESASSSGNGIEEKTVAENGRW